MGPGNRPNLQQDNNLNWELPQFTAGQQPEHPVRDTVELGLPMTCFFCWEDPPRT